LKKGKKTKKKCDMGSYHGGKGQRAVVQQKKRKAGGSIFDPKKGGG